MGPKNKVKELIRRDKELLDCFKKYNDGKLEDQISFIEDILEMREYDGIDPEDNSKKRTLLKSIRREIEQLIHLHLNMDSNDYEYIILYLAKKINTDREAIINMCLIIGLQSLFDVIIKTEKIIN